MITGFKGTKGEWTIEGEFTLEDNYSKYLKDEKGTHLLTFSTLLDGKNNHLKIVEAKANAQLIAAAPIMLDALVRIKSELLRCDILDEKMEELINATLAKATGGQP